MHKFWRVIVPTSQVVAFVGVFLAGKLGDSQSFYFNGYLPAKIVVISLNFPLLTFWSPAAYCLDHSSAKLVRAPGEAAVKTFAILAGLVFLSTVALFWYFVVAEIQLRAQGKSRLRCSTLAKQVFMTTGLVCFGTGAIFVAYDQLKPLWHVSWREMALRGVFLAVWAIVLIAIGAFDLARLLRRRRSITPTAYGEP